MINTHLSKVRCEPIANGLARREMLGLALMATLPRSLLASTSEVNIRSNAVRQINQWCEQARVLLTHGRVLEALTLLTRANDLIETDPASLWPWRLRVGGDLGFALLEIGRADEAREVLELSQAAENRVRAEQTPPYFGLVSRHDTGMGRMMIGVEFKRQLMSVVVTAGPGPRNLDELVWDTSIGTSEQLFNLGRALLASDRQDELARHYREQVCLDRSQEENPFSRYTVELRHFKFGVLLSQSGAGGLSYEAFRRALELNFSRIQLSAPNVASPTAIYGAIGVGQRMLSVWLGQAMGEGEVSTKDRSFELLTAILQLKGLGIRYAERLNTLLHSSSEPRTVAVAAQINEFEEKLAGLPVSQQALAALLALELQKGVALTQVLPELAKQGLGDVVVKGTQILPTLRQLLGSDAAIGFLAYTPLASGNGRSPAAAPKRYLRYCIVGHVIDLRDVGSAADIDRDVFGFRRELLAGEDGQVKGSKLHAKLLRGLPAEATQSRDWVIDPDGSLALLPFEALRDDQGGLLLDLHSIRYVSSLAQMTSQVHVKVATGASCIVANPTYPRQMHQGGAFRSMRLSEAVLRSGQLAIPQLPETEQEASAVAQGMETLGWQVNRYEAGAATASRLLEIEHAPRVLHVACHAVMLDSGIATSVSDRTPDLAVDAVLDMVLPGRRSALVLAGDSAPSIFLAKDFSRLPIQGTQLAVLSACDTGNGDIELGEGVSGLRRALEQAGVASSVTSLWPVPSRATVALMTSFYKHLGQRRRKSHALQLAKQEVMKTGASAHAWAGFLLAGSDDALDAVG